MQSQKLTKSEQKMFDLAKRFGGTYAAEVVSGCGAKGGVVKQGKRDAMAVESLVEKGFAVIVDRQNSAQSNNGYTLKFYSIVYQIV